ncbi:hypothetical protein LAZ67_6003539 [Cordylochernes scorpioides]|uniref:Reverse transcriptase domain-containing protein n=1 Tax=Cordylochernes scorpioides TaxID=51811 RepID=A0ABY6KPB4_9ARAC|nr:hypothetical protein LAZ67_6003539 [Cordylochernes scorpioides]
MRDLEELDNRLMAFHMVWSVTFKFSIKWSQLVLSCSLDFRVCALGDVFVHGDIYDVWRDGWLRHTSRAFQIAVSSQVKFDEICPAPSLILMFVPSCSIMLIPAPPLLRVRSEDPSVYAVEGRGLAFLIKKLYYEDIAVNIPNTLDLETQGIKVYLNQNKAINIYNMYHPPNNTFIDDGTMAQFLTDNTIILGDLNAKHQLWGCSTPNPRGKILSNIFDDNAFMCLNDGNPTHHSYSYNTAQALDINGTLATNDKIAANLLGNSYQISSKINVEKRPERLFMTVKMSPALIIFSMKKINMKKLAYALENTDLNKTPGPDGIHGRMISNLGKIGKERLLNIFNNSWKTGKLPQDCKNATIIPIKKLDKSADDPKNYRPISLTNICCKLMEKFIFTYHPDTRNLLPEEQYGYRKGHGTIVQLLFFTQKTLHKLLVRVKYNGTLSKTFKLYQGLPQGSVLSPTLFTLSIAGIEDKFSHKTNIGLFADDIILWSSNTNWKKAERDLNKTILHLEKFANKQKLEFNPQKSETCLFTTDKKLSKIRTNIILKEQQLQYNKHPKYLGYTLDPEINSSKHIEGVEEWRAEATTLKLTYTSLMRPIFEYGYQIYGTASETNLKTLERIQLNAPRIITGLRKHCPNDIELYEADIMPLKNRISYNLPKYINKINENKHRTFNYILIWEPNIRLKKEGPLHLAKRNGFLKYKVENII